MSGLAKMLLAAALTLPLLAFVVVDLAAPDEPAINRSRPVIIGQVGDDARPESPQPRKPKRAHDTRPADRGPDTDDADEGAGDDGDDNSDDGALEPATVVTPRPQDLDDEDDDDGVGDDDDDGDDDDSDDDGDD